jgi:DNA damage-binding protein 1
VDGKEEYFTRLCAATVSAQPQEGPEAVVGELLLFDVESKSDSTHGGNGNMVSVWCRLDVAGCVYSICDIKGMLAVTKDHSVWTWSQRHITHLTNTRLLQVVLLRLEHLGSGDFRLVKQSEWNHNYVITQVTPLGTSELAIGDAISSVSVLTVTEDRLLKTAARDSTALWPVAIGALDEKTVVGVNVDCNFFSFRYAVGNAKLENDGIWHLGDFVNRLIPGLSPPCSLQSDWQVNLPYHQVHSRR